MLSDSCRQEFHNSWLPNLTDTGLNRLIDLLERQSPLLIHRDFAHGSLMGCLATHAAWNHPATCHLGEDAGITWLSHVAHVRASEVVREWDSVATFSWKARAEFLQLLRTERLRRKSEVAPPDPAIPTTERDSLAARLRLPLTV